MTKIILTRHGHVEGIKPERFRGREPLQLTTRGTAEAAALAQRIGARWRPSRIYTSPMGRCVATAAAIARATGIAAKTCEDLNDIDYGAWQFKTFAQAKAQDALRMVLARHPRETVVLVGHDSVNRALLLELLDQPLSAYWRLAQEPCCINEIDVNESAVRVRSINATQHLEAVAAEVDAK